MQPSNMDNINTYVTAFEQLAAQMSSFIPEIGDAILMYLEQELASPKPLSLDFILKTLLETALLHLRESTTQFLTFMTDAL